ncbi:MAG TPA: polymer-forming cytoskeletal protein [Vicinamibacterales bacterium]|nr:polymer-forming cytoskeletal protein [Vicinamibacterales bacterium]
MRAHDVVDGPSRLPAGLTIVGELSSGQDLVIAGRFDGQITMPDRGVTISETGRVHAKIVARTITVAGRVEGTLVASARITLDETASVEAHLQTPSLTMKDGARFTGTVDPERTAAAVSVARYRQKQADEPDVKPG